MRVARWTEIHIRYNIEISRNYDFQQPFVPGGADIAAFTILS
jgi:hypothetical protein